MGYLLLIADVGHLEWWIWKMNSEICNIKKCIEENIREGYTRIQVNELLLFKYNICYNAKVCWKEVIKFIYFFKTC